MKKLLLILCVAALLPNAQATAGEGAFGAGGFFDFYIPLFNFKDMYDSGTKLGGTAHYIYHERKMVEVEFHHARFNDGSLETRTFRNTGTQGLRDDSRLGADAGLMYPGWGIGERDFTEYWIIGQDNDHRYHTSQGEGFWVFTKEGGSYKDALQLLTLPMLSWIPRDSGSKTFPQGATANPAQPLLKPNPSISLVCVDCPSFLVARIYRCHCLCLGLYCCHLAPPVV